MPIQCTCGETFENRHDATDHVFDVHDPLEGYLHETVEPTQ